MKGKLIVSIIISISLFFALTAVIFYANYNVQNDKTNALAPLVATSSSQTNPYTVKSIQSLRVDPGTYWYQNAQKKWVADTQFGRVIVENKNGFPTPTVIKERFDLSTFQIPSGTTFETLDKSKRFTIGQLNETYIASGKDVEFIDAPSFKGKGIEVEQGSKVVLLFESGYGYHHTTYEMYNKTAKLHRVMYLTPFNVYWTGKLLETKEIRATSDFIIGVGKSQNLKAEVRTKTGTGSWSVYYDKTTVTTETTWRSDNPSVVSVDSTGKIKALKKGTATIHVNWKSSDGDYHITTKTVVTVKDAPTLDITGNVDMCFDKGSTTLTALYSSGNSINVTNLPTTKWTSSNTSIATVDKGKVTFKKVGEVAITVQYLEETANVIVKINDCSVPVVPEPAVPDNIPPTVDIITDKEILVGNNLCINAVAIDKDGFIIRYDWNIPSFVTVDNDTNKSTICGYFNETGSKDLTVTVTDNGDVNGKNQLQGTDQHTVQVGSVPPQAYVQIGGTLKQNRKITITPQHPYGGNDILLSVAPIIKQTLTIEAIKMENTSQLKIVQDITRDVSHGQEIEFLAKFTGQVKITRYVENNKGQSDKFETIIDIAPDLKPSTDVQASEIVYRDTYPDGSVYATIHVTMDSKSTDSDIIQKNTIKYKYDQNNNGRFDDENWQQLYDGQLNEAKITTEKVGKYLICGQAWERFGQDTINQFVNLTFNEKETDLKFTDDTDTSCSTVEVKNLAPNVSFDLMEEKEVELYFHLDDSNLTKAEIETAINQYVKPKLASENIKINYSIGDTDYYENPVALWFTQDVQPYSYSGIIQTHNYLFDLDTKAYISLPNYFTKEKTAMDYEKNLYTVAYGNQIVKWEFETNTTSVIATASSNVSNKTYSIENVYVDANGDIYYVEKESSGGINNYHVYKYNQQTKQSELYRKTVHASNPYYLDTWVGVQQVLNGSVYTKIVQNTSMYPFLIYNEGNAFLLSGMKADLSRPTIKNNVITQGFRQQATNYPYTPLSGVAVNNKVTTYFNDYSVSSVHYPSYDGYPIFPLNDGTFLVQRYNQFVHVTSNSVDSSMVHSLGSSVSTVSKSYNDYFGFTEYFEGTTDTIITAIGDDVYYFVENADTPFTVKKYNIKNRTVTNVYSITEADKQKITYDYRKSLIYPFNTPVIYDKKPLADTIKGVKWKTDNEQKYFINLSQDNIRGGNEVSKVVSELDKNNINFISIDTWNTKFIAEKILYEMDFESTQFTVSTITDKQTAMTSLADHLLAVLNDERVEVQVDAIGDGKGTIRNGLKQMNTVLKEYDVFANVTVKRNEFGNSVQFTPSDTTIALKKTSSQILSSIDSQYIDAAKKSFAYGVIASDFNSNTVQNVINTIGKGKEIRSTDWNTIQQSLSEYILNIVQGKTLEVHIYGNGKYDLTAIQNLVNTQLVNKLSETSLEVERVLVKPLNSNFNYTDYNFGGKQRFVVALTDNYSDAFKNHFKAGNLIANSHFIAVTDNQTAKGAANEIIQASMKKGTVIDYKSLQSSIDSVGNYIVDFLLNNPGLEERYITKSNLGSVQVSYLDYESDPKINEVWRFNQELTYFENEEGYTANANKDLSGANITFDKVGKYLPTYKAQDNPTLKIPSNLRQAFDNYKMWSEPISNLILYVHREPRANFEIKVNKDTGSFTVNSKAYDLDKYSIDIGFGPGLQSQQWSYKKVEENVWYVGLPSGNIGADSKYLIRNTVTDFQGKTAILVKEVSREKLPPVADFKTDKALYDTTESVRVTNSSYHPNNDNLTANWYVKTKDAADSTYRHLATGSFTSNTAQPNWHPVFSNIGCASPSSVGICDYEIKLVVNDTSGTTDIAVRSISIRRNFAPVANFETDKYLYEVGETVRITNHSYDQNGDNLTARWLLKGKTQSDASYAQFATGSLVNGIGQGNWHPTIPNVACPTPNADRICEYSIKLIVTDASGLTHEVVKNYQVIIRNTEPVACMQIPSPIFINDVVQIKNCATDPEGDPLQIRYVLEMPVNNLLLDYTYGHDNISNVGDLLIWFGQVEQIGEWRITQYVSDGMYTVTTSGTFQVLNQTVQGQVQHTEQWLRNIQNFNSNFNSKMNPGKQFNLNANKGLLEFFKGERFILKASETGRAKEITVKIAEYPQFQTKLTENTVDLWDGNLWNEAMFYTFKDKEVLTFVFEATFANDWKATSTVQIRIRDDNYFTQHTSY